MQSFEKEDIMCPNPRSFPALPITWFSLLLYFVGRSDGKDEDERKSNLIILYQMLRRYALLICGIVPQVVT